MSKVLIDAQLLGKCLSLHNQRLSEGLCCQTRTYDLANHLNQALLEQPNVEGLEGLQKVVDSQSLALIREISEDSQWIANPSLHHHVVIVQGMVIALGMIDRYNYHMDMFGREDLVLPTTSTAMPSQ